MKSLWEELKVVLDKNNLNEILNVIDNRAESARLIKKLINDNMNLPCDKITINSLKNNFGDRINHILFTFSLGILLAKFKGLDKLIESEYKQYYKLNENNVFLKTWLIISLYHDYGYFLLNDPKYNDVTSLNDIPVENSIFDYICEKNEAFRLFGLDYLKCEKSRYSKELYDSYLKYRLNNDKEKEFLEHGILGGYVLFDDIIKNNSNPKVQIIKNIKDSMLINENNISSDMFYQNICYRIMEHNIWIINPSDANKTANLPYLKEVYSSNFKKITTEEPLLYLLSLVDTIEFIKRMSTTSLDNPSSQSRPSTLSKKIMIEVEYDHIYIDTSETKKVTGHNNWCNGIITLKDWLDISSVISDELITIK